MSALLDFHLLIPKLSVGHFTFWEHGSLVLTLFAPLVFRETIHCFDGYISNTLIIGMLVILFNTYESLLWQIQWCKLYSLGTSTVATKSIVNPAVLNISHGTVSLPSHPCVTANIFFVGAWVWKILQSGIGGHCLQLKFSQKVQILFKARWKFSHLLFAPQGRFKVIYLSFWCCWPTIFLGFQSNTNLGRFFKRLKN